VGTNPSVIASLLKASVALSSLSLFFKNLQFVPCNPHLIKTFSFKKKDFLNLWRIYDIKSLEYFTKYNLKGNELLDRYFILYKFIKFNIVFCFF